MDLWDSKTTLRKPNASLVMVPRVGKLTPNARKLYNVILLRTQQMVLEARRKGESIPATHFFAAPLLDLVSLVTSAKSDPKTSAKNYFREMRRIEVDWEAPDATTGVIWNSMSLLSQAKIEIKQNILWAHWALAPDLLLAVSDPERYTPLDLAYMMDLKSYAAIALYELCSRYKNNPTKVTARAPPAWWVDALSSAPADIDPETTRPRIREWRKFKSEQLKVAIEEINKSTDLDVELIEFRESRAVTEVQFSVRKKPVASAPLHAISPELAIFATRLGVPLKHIENHLKRGRTRDQVMLGLAGLEARKSRADLATVQQPSGYLTRLLDFGPGLTQGSPDGESETPSGSRESAPAIPKASINEPIPGGLPTPAAPWRDQRRSEVRAELLALPQETQNKYVEQGRRALQEMNLLRPSMARNLAIGSWKSGLMLSKVVECYALDVYGPDWLVEPAVQTAVL